MVCLLAAPWLAAATVLLSHQATAAPKVFLITTQDDPKEANEDAKNYQQENGSDYADSDDEGTNSADSDDEGSDNADSDKEGIDYSHVDSNLDRKQRERQTTDSDDEGSDSADSDDEGSDSADSDNHERKLREPQTIISPFGTALIG